MSENEEILEIQDSMMTEESTAEPRVRKIVSDLKNLRSYFNWKDFSSALIFGFGKAFLFLNYNTFYCFV